METDMKNQFSLISLQIDKMLVTLSICCKGKTFPVERDENKVPLEPIAVKCSHDQNIGADLPFPKFRETVLAAGHYPLQT